MHKYELQYREQLLEKLVVYSGNNLRSHRVFVLYSYLTNNQGDFDVNIMPEIYSLLTLVMFEHQKCDRYEKEILNNATVK